MKTDRLNAFTDGVIAIIITIMVLELPVPKGAGMSALKPELTLFAAYALAFIKVGIYWFQHHHLLLASRRVDGRVLLANLFFLFWLSLVPFVVRWVGEAGVTKDTVLAFGILMLLCASSVAVLRATLLAANEDDAPIAKLAARGRKGQVTIFSYVAAIGVAFLWPLAAVAIYFAVAALWLVPDKRFEKLTIMVLELKFPAEPTLSAALAVLPLLAAYLLAFVNVAIYWNNHHHMMQSARHVTGGVLWANHALLFCLTLFPLMIRWIDEAGVTPWPVASFGLVLSGAALAYRVLQRALAAADDSTSRIREVMTHPLKEYSSLVLYIAAIGTAFIEPYVSVAIYVAVSIIWIVPDRRFVKDD